MTFYHFAQICTCSSLNNIIISPSSSHGLAYIHKQFLFGPYDLLKTVIKRMKTVMGCEPQSHPSHIMCFDVSSKRVLLPEENVWEDDW